MDYTVQFETFVETYEEALPLISEHWEEVPFGKWPDIGVNVNTGVYVLMEDQGFLRLMTARTPEGEMIGYVILMCAEMNHHIGVLQVTTDVVYVHPDYRSAGVMSKMLEVMKADCKEKGVEFFSVTVNPNYDFGGYLEEMGAVPTETSYTWRL